MIKYYNLIVNNLRKTDYYTKGIDSPFVRYAEYGGIFKLRPLNVCSSDKLDDFIDKNYIRYNYEI